MTELELVDQLRRRFRVTGRGLVLGIGDDCAIFRASGASEDLVFTTDQTIEGVHFQRGTLARKVGQRALARALSDIAAMGAEPRFCLISLAAPARFDTDSFFRGIGQIADRYRFSVAGGDLARSRVLTCDAIVCGAVPRGTALRRDGARPGDEIYVSGPLGAAAALGFRAIPSPRITFGRTLRGRATSCMDLSDGLSTDLYHLCAASRVGAYLHEIPVAPGATLEQALHGGEDYELLYTGRELPGLRIGIVNSEPSGFIVYQGYPLSPGGWDHFRERGSRPGLIE